MPRQFVIGLGVNEVGLLSSIANEICVAHDLSMICLWLRNDELSFEREPLIDQGVKRTHKIAALS